jgi:hypothetical protein|tara:strand:+ start:4690 stop:4824 length:135 start_codon:yes stop_codon:yes gene_type:complete
MITDINKKGDGVLEAGERPAAGHRPTEAGSQRITESGASLKRRI